MSTAAVEPEPETPEPGVDDAVPEVTPDEEDTTKLPVEPRPPKIETIAIDGRDVPTAEVAEYFDPNCELRCDEGALTKGVAPPKDFKQLRGRILQITVLCPCAVHRYRKEHPAPVELVAGSAALRAAADLPPAGPDPRAAKVQRIRAELDKRRAELAATRADKEERAAPLLLELEDRVRDEGNADYARRSAAASLRHFETEIAAQEAVLVTLRACAAEAETKLVAAKAAVVDANEAANIAQRRLTTITCQESPTERALVRKIEQCERRIELILRRHPEAANG